MIGYQPITKEILPAEVHGADSAFFCGTAAEVIGIEAIDKIAFTKNWNDSFGAKIQMAYKDLVVEKHYTLVPETA